MKRIRNFLLSLCALTGVLLAAGMAPQPTTSDAPVVGLMIGHWSGSDYPLAVAYYGDETFGAKELQEGNLEWSGNWKITKGWDVRLQAKRFEIHGFRIFNRVFAMVHCNGSVGFGCFDVLYDGC